MLYMYKLSNLLQCELFVNKVREYRRDNPQKLATQGTQDEGTIQRNCQHRVYKTKGQSRETDNIGYTRRRDNPEKLPTQGTQDEGTIQRNCQHRVHKTKGQSREIANIGYTRRRKTQHYVLDTTIRKHTNKTCALLQTTGGQDEPNIVFMRKS